MRRTLVWGAVSGVLLAWNSPVQAQRGQHAKFVGEWAGSLVTNVLRGQITLVVTAGSDFPSIDFGMRAGERVVQDRADSIVLVGDTIRWKNSVGGGRVHFTGMPKGDSLQGTLVVMQGSVEVTRGQWSVGRSRTSVDKPASGSDIFNALWSIIDARYGNFTCKSIDWSRVRTAYTPLFAAATDAGEVQRLLGEVVGLLNDNHVWIDGFARTISSGRRGRTRVGEFSRNVVSSKTLAPLRSLTGGAFAHGWLPDSVGYVHISEFPAPGQFVAGLDSVLLQLRGMRALVVDLRDNRGGSDASGNALLDRIADRRRLYMTSRARGSGGHLDYLPPKQFFMQPTTNAFAGPVALLTNGRSVSAAENVVMGALELPHVMVVGDITAGAYADVTRESLPDGLTLFYPFNTMADARGRCWEGLGHAPGYFMVNDSAEVAAGIDRVLDLSRRLLRRAPR